MVNTLHGRECTSGWLSVTIFLATYVLELLWHVSVVTAALLPPYTGWRQVLEDARVLYSR